MSSSRLLRHFRCAHLPAYVQEIVEPCGVLAALMAEALESPQPDVNAEVAAGLRKLLEATDCFVRARHALGQEGVS